LISEKSRKILKKDGNKRKIDLLETFDNRNDIKKKKDILSPTALKNKESNVHIIKGFNKKFQRCFESVEKFHTNSLNYDQMCTFCHLFGCLPNKGRGNESVLLQEMWKDLKGNESSKGVTRDNLVKLMKEILQIQTNKQVHKKYYQFYLNTRYANNIKIEQVSLDEYIPSFTPQLSAKTKKIIELSKSVKDNVPVEAKLLKLDKELKK